MTELLSAGYTHTLTQNVVYALPSKAAFIESSDVLEGSLDGSTFVALANSTTGTQVTVPFVRSTVSTNIVIVKQY